ncbi:MAG: RND family efflux transporter MFP subunit, partial [Bradymonadia bacterium]
MATVANTYFDAAAPLRVVMLAAAILAASGCSSGEDASAGGPPSGEDAPPQGVRVSVAESGRLDVEQPFTGDVVALRSVQLSPDVAGRLDELLVDEGDLVTVGQVIARLDDTVARYDASLERQRVETARARVARAAAEITANGAEQSRLRPLVEAGARTSSELVSLAERAEVLATDLDVAQAELDAQRGAASAASVRRDRAEVVAPFDGIVVTRHVSVGAQVDARTPVVDIVDRSSLRVRVEVP